MSGDVLNFNVGVLGHVDSGKTSLSKSLSTVASTASFDKNPQSQERGITIDLGFSSFSVDVPGHIGGSYSVLQFTLVDCPGHASLIRTIIGGAQIIDLIILVIDVTKGMQTQTAECLIIGEITCDKMVVVLNKIDLIPVEKRDQTVQKMTKKILKTLENTKFKDSDVVPVSAKPTDCDPIGMSALVDALKQHVFVPQRSDKGPLMFAVDHCFIIKGQGTVMTGTVIQGSVSIGDSVEIPSVKLTRKVKSIQMFKKPITKAVQGDRVGICVVQFDPNILERGTICSPGYMDLVDCVVVNIQKIPYFKGKYETGSKFHVSIMHDTVTAKCSFFASLNNSLKTLKIDTEKGSESIEKFEFDQDYLHLAEIPDPNSPESLEVSSVYGLLQFDRPIILNDGSTYIASKLETNIHDNVCRLAFHGKILASVPSGKSDLSKLQVYKEKSREGVVDRMANEYQVIVRDLFKKETNLQIFYNLKVALSTGEVGVIEGSFGQSGKVNVRIPNGLSQEALSVLSVKKGKKETAKEKTDSIKIILNFKKYIYDKKKKIFQSK
ncbi:hypothetical protein JTE90_008559 [Oedothorax gibbosus]|uniref:Selenocysteine-specific elongation factor n=1 Tax=Oedothorax gibbosus TaxID=931172 RepID=A0AAV6TXN4_9ARAC|nr:hypothetical protein JTE90_008559 [Oedothorax gibbosus]